MKPERKKVYGRIQTNVDDRTPGIRTATRATEAKGDMYSSQVVHVTNDGINKWAAFLPALGSLIKMGETIFNKKESEEERLRLKREREMDNRLQQLQAWEADKWTMDLQDRLSDAVNRGEISSTDELSGWMQRETEGLDASQDAAFIQQARGKLDHIFRTTQEQISQKAQGEFNTNIVGQVQDGIAKALSTQDFDTDEGRQILSDAREKGRELFLAAGKTTLEYDAVELKSLHQAARNAIREDPARAMALLDIAETVTGAYESTSTLRTDLERELNEWSDKEEVKARKDEAQKWQDNRLETYSKLAGMTADDRAAFLGSLKGDHAGSYALYGNSLMDVYNDVLRFDEFERRQDGVEKKAIQDASQKIAEGYLNNILNGKHVSRRAVLESDMLFPDKQSVIEFMDSEDARSAKMMREHATAGFDYLVRNMAKDSKVKLGYKVDAQGNLVDGDEEQMIGHLNYIEAQLRTVKRQDFSDGPEGDRDFEFKLREARVQAAKNILSGAEGTLFKTPGDKSSDPSSATPVLREATWEQYQSYPSLEKSLREQVFSGIDEVPVDKTESGRPIAARGVNWAFVKGIQDPQVRKEADDMIHLAALQRRAERMRIPERGSIASFWLGQAESEDEQDERAYRREQEQKALEGLQGPDPALINERFEAVKEVRKDFERFDTNGRLKPEYK